MFFSILWFRWEQVLPWFEFYCLIQCFIILQELFLRIVILVEFSFKDSVIKDLDQQGFLDLSCKKLILIKRKKKAKNSPRKNIEKFHKKKIKMLKVHQHLPHFISLWSSFSDFLKKNSRNFKLKFNRNSKIYKISEFPSTFIEGPNFKKNDHKQMNHCNFFNILKSNQNALSFLVNFEQRKFSTFRSISQRKERKSNKNKKPKNDKKAHEYFNEILKIFIDNLCVIGVQVLRTYCRLKSDIPKEFSSTIEFSF